MGLAKNIGKINGIEISRNAPDCNITAAATAESGSQAAIDRLKAVTPKIETPKAQYKPRDFDAEARGKTRCVQFEAAVMSPAIAGMAFQTTEEYIALVKKVADAGVAYTFQDNA